MTSSGLHPSPSLRTAPRRAPTAWSARSSAGSSPARRTACACARCTPSLPVRFPPCGIRALVGALFVVSLIAFAPLGPFGILSSVPLHNRPQRTSAAALEAESGAVASAATSALDRARLLPHLHRDRAHPLPHLHRDRARLLPHLHRDWAHPLPHLHRDCLTPCHICTAAAAHICTGTGLAGPGERVGQSGPRPRTFGGTTRKGLLQPSSCCGFLRAVQQTVGAVPHKDVLRVGAGRADDRRAHSTLAHGTALRLSTAHVRALAPQQLCWACASSARGAHRVLGVRIEAKRAVLPLWPTGFSRSRRHRRLIRATAP